MKTSKFRLFLRVFISLVLMFFLYRRVNFSQMQETFAHAQLLPLLLVFIQLFINTAISAFKWQLLLKSDNIHIPLNNLISSYLIGSFFNIFLPSNIGGDVYRVYDVARYSKRTAHSFASVLADRLSGFVALVLIGFAFGIFGMKHLPNHDVLWVPFGTMLLLVIIIGTLFQQKLAHWVLNGPLFNKLAKLKSFGLGLLESVSQYRQAPGLFTQIMLISFLFQFNAICCIYVMSVALNLHIPFLYFCIFIPFISLIEAIPISIYGLGLRDATYVFFFGSVGITQVQALTMALSYVFITLMYSLSGGILFILRPSSKKDA